MPFGEDWAVLITPGYAFTRDGFGNPIGREKINILSTKRAARDFNPTVHHDVTFWASVLSDEAEGLFALACGDQNDLAKFAPKILLSRQQPTVAFNTASAFGREGPDAEFEEVPVDLDDELTKLAEEDGEEHDSTNGKDKPDEADDH